SPAGRRRRRGGAASDCVAALKTRLAPYGLADALTLYAINGATVPDDVAQGCPDLDAAAGADVLLNLWHSAPPRVVERFRRSAFIDTDPGLLQIWMTTGAVHLAPHDVYFTIGETVGTRVARFPDCGLRWLYTPPPIFLPEWPQVPELSSRTAPYTTVAHWWGGTFQFNGITFSNEKRASFLEYQNLPQRTPVSLELAVCLAEFHEEYRRLLEPMGWRLREAWPARSSKSTSTPGASWPGCWNRRSGTRRGPQRDPGRAPPPPPGRNTGRRQYARRAGVDRAVAGSPRAASGRRSHRSRDERAAAQGEGVPVAVRRARAVELGGGQAHGAGRRAPHPPVGHAVAASPRAAARLPAAARHGGRLARRSRVAHPRGP